MVSELKKKPNPTPAGPPGPITPNPKLYAARAREIPSASRRRQPLQSLSLPILSLLSPNPLSSLACKPPRRQAAATEALRARPAEPRPRPRAARALQPPSTTRQGASSCPAARAVATPAPRTRAKTAATVRCSPCVIERQSNCFFLPRYSLVTDASMAIEDVDRSLSLADLLSTPCSL